LPQLSSGPLGSATSRHTAVVPDWNKDYIIVDIKEAIMKLSTAVKPISYLKAHASELIRDITNTRQALVVTCNGEAKVVVQDIRSYERMLETLALLKILTRSKQNIKRGKVKTLDNTFTSLEKRIRAFKNERV
jgi:prevent-host-death family protein